MKKKLGTIGVALGVTTIFLFWILDPIISSSHEAIYHWDGTASQLFVTPILDFCGFWVLLTLMLLFPIPRPSGIYDRKTDSFALTHSSYLDNVALADKFLEHVRSKLEPGGQWDSSTVVVMADHSWRTASMWRGSPELTEEEETASKGGKFDDRPAYIVKLPKEHAGARIDAPFAALSTRRPFEALLAQKIRSKEELSAWANREWALNGGDLHRPSLAAPLLREAAGLR